jgi:hypothetical protein
VLGDVALDATAGDGPRQLAASRHGADRRVATTVASATRSPRSSQRLNRFDGFSHSASVPRLLVD